jgi:hypothetical protein
MIPSLLKRGDTKWFIPVNSKFPVRHQLIPVNIDPNLHHPKLTSRKFSGKESAIFNRYRRFFPLVSYMNVWRVVLCNISIEN